MRTKSHTEHENVHIKIVSLLKYFDSAAMNSLLNTETAEKRLSRKLKKHSIDFINS